jgi:hypothetical protein
MILGFTGTRRQPSNPQIDWLRAYLNAMWARQEIDQLHHGACIGSDAFAHMMCLRARIPIVVHPPVNQRFVYLPAIAIHRAPHVVSVLKAKPYMDRNRAIVDACDRLIALPDGPPRPHSGTWGTINYAAEGHRVPITICWPDREIEAR